jgi:hypothetical protein
MISNIPAFAVHQDYQARHSDMLAAARGILTIERLPDVSQRTVRQHIVAALQDLSYSYQCQRLASGPKNGQP